MNDRMRSWSRIAILFVATTLILSVATLAADDVTSKVPKLQGILKELHENYLTGAKDKIASMVSSRDLFVSNDKIRVMLEIAPGATLNEADLLSYGVEVERKHASFWRVLAPIGSLARLAAEVQGVGYIRTPAKAIPEYTGQGPALTGANTWHAAGYRGAGVKVAVIDGSYAFLTPQGGYSGSDLPAHTKVNYTGGAFQGTYPAESFHGTAVAEILMDMAPDADLTLIKIDDESDLDDAKNYCIANSIKVIVMSLGYYNLGDYAGNGPISDIVNDAYSNGILWVKSAGNNAAGGHYRATFSDPNVDTWHNFSGAVENNSLGSITVGNAITLYMSWGWPTSAQDYDLYLYRGAGILVASSNNPQTGTEPPTEEISITAPATDTYYIKIKRVNATGTEELTVFSVGYGALTYNEAARSLSQPADAATCFAVGALSRCSWPAGASVESFSSRGPTYDGRIKPDITAPSRVCVNILTCDACGIGGYGFGGTSSAAPHAAGAGALVFSAFPGYTVDQVRSYLETRATDKGPAGKDNEWGAGLLQMGGLPTAEALTVTAPNGGEIWVVGDSHNITWTSSGASALVDIVYSIDGGATWTPIFSNTANDGSEPWTIPNTPSANCLVRITDDDGSPTDVSNAVFTISAGGQTCDPASLTLLGYRTVSWNPPFWEVEVQMLNSGPGHADQITAVMNEDIPWLTIPDPGCTYGFLCPGEAGWADWDGYTFDLTNHPGGSFSVWFDVTFIDDCGNPQRVRLDPEFEPGVTADGPRAVIVTRLGQNYPNPFNPSTTISFQLAAPDRVNLSVYDVAGKLVRTLVNEQRSKGLHAVNWDGKDNNGVLAASGIYFYKIQAGAFTETKKMVLAR